MVQGTTTCICSRVPGYLVLETVTGSSLAVIYFSVQEQVYSKYKLVLSMQTKYKYLHAGTRYLYFKYLKFSNYVISYSYLTCRSAGQSR